jgi:hypothetical protein
MKSTSWSTVLVTVASDLFEKLHYVGHESAHSSMNDNEK